MERRNLVEDVARRIARIERPHPVRVAIDGVDAAGKTTFADELALALSDLRRPVIRASIDGFHNPAAIRYQRGAMSPKGFFHDSFNYTALVEALLQPLGPDGSLEIRRAVFDFRTDTIVHAPLERTEPNAILLLDGVFLLRPELRGHFDFSIFLRVDFSTTMARAERRDLELLGNVGEVRRRYHERYIPGQRIYLTTAEPERWASVVVDNNDPDQPIAIGARASGT